MSFRVGCGFDAHRFASGRPLVLGGIRIPYPRGLHGHSDADVLLHAVGDALLGAAALGDLGEHFPDSDPRWHNVSSVRLLAEIAAMVQAAGFRILAVDATVVAEEPKLAPYRQSMVSSIATVLQLPPEQVSLKATTTEGMGFTGRKEGIAAWAVVMVQKTSGETTTDD